MKTTCLIPLIALLVSCAQDKIVSLGILPIEDNDSLSIEIYQKREFDSSTPVYYRVIYSETGYSYIPRTFLTGTADYLTDVSHFTSRQIDKYIILTFINDKEIFMIHDLELNFGGPHRTDPYHEGYSKGMSRGMRITEELRKIDSTYHHFWSR